MSAKVHILVEFVDGKPRLTLGWTPTVRAYTRKGTAENYAKGLVAEREFTRVRDADRGREVQPPLDVRVLTIAIPDEGPVGDGIWPDLVPEIAVNWS